MTTSGGLGQRASRTPPTDHAGSGDATTSGDLGQRASRTPPTDHAGGGDATAPASHYFSPVPVAPSRPRLVRLDLGERQFQFRTDAGVFSPGAVDRGTRLLLDVVDPAGADWILDLGCGYGTIGVVMAARAPRARVLLVDINPRAVALAVENIALNAVKNAEVRSGDGCAPVAGVEFDLILCNPPIRAGRAVVMRLLREARSCLRPRGRLYLVARTGQGARTLGRLMADLYGGVTEVARGGGFRVYEASGV